MTVVFGVVDADRQRLTLASAGHPAPLIRRCAPDGDPVAEYLDVPAGAPLGLGCRPRTVTVPFAPGDTLLLFSDGVVERRWQEPDDRPGRPGRRRGRRGQRRPPRVVRGGHRGGARRHRGRRRGAGGGARAAAVPVDEHGGAGRADRAEPGTALDDRRSSREWQVPESMIGAAVLCTSELTTNALLHAGTAARVEIDLSPERLLVSVADSGTRGTVTRAQTDTLSSRGRGLGLIEELSDAWGTDPTGTRLDGLVRDPDPAGVSGGVSPARRGRRTVMPTDKPTGVLFDVDGTLVDTTYLHTVSWWEALRQTDRPVPMATIHRAIGMGSDKLLDHLLGPERDRSADQKLRDAHDTLFAEYWERLVAAAPRRRPAARLRGARTAGGAGDLRRRARGDRAAPGAGRRRRDPHDHLLGGRARRASRRRTSWSPRWSSPGSPPNAWSSSVTRCGTSPPPASWTSPASV